MGYREKDKQRATAVLEAAPPALHGSSSQGHLKDPVKNGGEGDSTYPKFCKLLIPTNIASNTHEYRRFFAFRPVCCFRPVRPVEPISAFYGQDGQEAQ